MARHHDETDPNQHVYEVAYRAYQDDGSYMDIVDAVRPVIEAEALREAADAIPARSAMSRVDADVWLHSRASRIIHTSAGLPKVPWRGSECEHPPEWQCDGHGECRGCECACGTYE